jgi:hypothetical protein
VGGVGLPSRHSRSVFALVASHGVCSAGFDGELFVVSRSRGRLEEELFCVVSIVGEGHVIIPNWPTRIGCSCRARVRTDYQGWWAHCTKSFAGLSTTTSGASQAVEKSPSH